MVTKKAIRYWRKPQLRLFGITLPAFKIAGGIILGLIGLEMVQAKRSPTKETPGDREESLAK
ncbi:MAG TPA: MarC family protein, partial [Dongiaceae bacterium]